MKKAADMPMNKPGQMPDKMPADMPSKPMTMDHGQPDCSMCGNPKTLWNSGTQMQPMKCGDSSCPMFNKS